MVFICALCLTSCTNDHEHELELIPAKAATCTQTGVMEGQKCSVCGTILVEQIVTQKVAHQFEGDFCIVCGESNPENSLKYTAIFDNDGTTLIGFEVSGMGNLKGTKVVIPTMKSGLPVTSIVLSAFSGNDEITEVIIGNNVTSIGNEAFYHCSSLTSVTIGSGVKTIGDYAFDNCSSLTSVTIPDSVTIIGSGAFSGCSSLISVYYFGSDVDWEKISTVDNNNQLTSATRYYYSESEPELNADGTAYDGNYLPYDTDGKTPVIWKK